MSKFNTGGIFGAEFELEGDENFTHPNANDATARILPTDLPEPDREYSFGDELKAMVDTSFLGNAFDYITDNGVYYLNAEKPNEEEAAKFDKWENFSGRGYSPEAAFTYDTQVSTYNDALLYDAKIKRQSEAKQTLSESGITGSALSFYSEIFMSPSGVASLAVPMGMLSKGGTLARTYAGAKVGAAMGAGIAAEKTLVDPLYKSEEALGTIAMSTAIMAGLGGAVGSLFKRANAGSLSVNGSDNTLDDFSNKFMDDADRLYTDFNARSMGAAAVAEKFNYTPVGNIFQIAITRITSIMSPSNRVANFVSQASRDFFTGIAGRPMYYTKGEAEGLALGDTVDDLRKLVETEYFRTTMNVRKLLKEYVVGDSKGIALNPFGATAKARRLGMEEASERVYSIIQNEKLSIDDIAAKALDDLDPEQALWKAAEQIRNHTAKELEDNLAMGLAGTTRRANYGLQLRMNKFKASKDQVGLLKQLTEDYQALVDHIKIKYANELSDIGSLRQAMAKEIDDFKASKTKEQLDEMQDEISAMTKEMDDIIEMIKAGDNAPLLYASKALGEIMHGRTPQVQYIRGSIVSDTPSFFLPRALDPLKYQKWAETNIEILMGIRGRQIGTRRAMHKIYGDAVGKGARNKYIQKMDETIAAQREIEASAGAVEDVGAIKGAVDKAKRKAKLQATADDLVKERNDVLNQFDDMLKTHLGEYAADFYNRHPYLASSIETIKTWNQLSMLGNVVAGSVGEHAAIQLHHGISATMPEYKKVVASLFKNGNFIKNLNLTAKELKGMNQAWDMAHWETISDIASLGGNIGDQSISGFATLENLKKYGYMINGLTLWDYTNRIIVAKTQLTVLSKKIMKVASGKATKYDTMDLAKLGISKSEAQSFVDAFNAGGIEEIDGLVFMRPDKMPQNIADKMKIVLNNDINRTAIRAKTGELPIGMGHPLVSLMTQFKQWPLLATQKYMVPAMQRADGQAMSSVATLVGFGTLGYMLKEFTAGRDLEGMNPADLLYGGITQSGIAGIAPDIGLDWAARNLGIQGGGAKYSGINSITDNIMGPTATTLKRIASASDIIPFGDDASEHTYKALKKLLPLNNHPVFNLLSKEEKQ